MRRQKSVCYGGNVTPALVGEEKSIRVTLFSCRPEMVESPLMAALRTAMPHVSDRHPLEPPRPDCHLVWDSAVALRALDAEHVLLLPSLRRASVVDLSALVDRLALGVEVLERPHRPDVRCREPVEYGPYETPVKPERMVGNTSAGCFIQANALGRLAHA